MTDDWFKPNHEGVGELLRSPEIEAMLRARMEPVRELAIATAPVFERGPHPGRYKESFREVESGRDNGANEPRAYARLVNDSPEALSVEFGTANNPAHHTMLHALAASGGQVKAVEASNTPRYHLNRAGKRKRVRRKK